MKPIMLLIPVIGAITGWLIIVTVLKVLFKPVVPVKIPMSKNYFQGLIPRKQVMLASGIKEIIETQLLSAVTRETGIAPELLNGLSVSIARGVKERTLKKIPGLIPGAVKEKIAGTVEDIVIREVPGLIDAVLDNLRSDQGQSTNFCALIEEKIKTYDVIKLEQDLVCSREVFYVKIVAAVIGFISGMIQIGVFLLAGV